MLCCLIGIILVVGCHQNTIITDNGNIPKTNPSNDVIITPDNIPSVEIVTNPVRVIFKIRAEFPNGSVMPDVVTMDGQVLQENTPITQGMHNFLVEKRGYLPKNEQVMVNDPDNDGIFGLNLLLETKQRIVILDIRDSVKNEVIIPDQITIVKIPEGQQQTLSDRSFIKPGQKKIVIQKQGYKSISEDITISPDEDPYIINFKMTPQ